LPTYPYDWRGFVRVKKKTSVGLLVFNPVRATVAYKIFDWVIDTIRDQGWKKSDPGFRINIPDPQNS
jgi:hypothetical protein